MAIKLVELDPNNEVDIREQGCLHNLTVEQVTATLGFAHNRLGGEKVRFDWQFTAEIDGAEPVICAVFECDDSAVAFRRYENDEEEPKSNDHDKLPTTWPYFYTVGPDIVFRTLFGSAYEPTPGVPINWELWADRKTPTDYSGFSFGVWRLSPGAETVADVKADPNVSAMSHDEVRMLLAAAQRTLGQDGFRSLDQGAYKLVERAAAIGITKGLVYHPDPVPALSDGDDYWLLHYRCDRCAHRWFDYWTGLVDGECPRCGRKRLTALQDSRKIATSELPAWVDVRPSE
jgi:hypothetical protein